MTSYAQAWQTDFERARSTAEYLRSGQPSEWQVKQLREKVEDLAGRLSAMERRPVDYAVGQGEVARRRAQLDELRSMANAVSGSIATYDDNRDPGSVGGAVTRSRLEQQRDTMQEHNRMLEELGRGVGRLHKQTGLIHEETSLHVRLLDDMEGDAERASSGLRAEALHAEKIRAKSRTFSLWVTILVLSVILIVLIFAGI